MAAGQPKRKEAANSVGRAADSTAEALLLGSTQQRGCCAVFWSWLCGEREPYREKTDAELRSEERARQALKDMPPPDMGWP